MKRWLVALFMLAAPPAFAQDAPWDCNDTANLPQLGLNMCTYQDYERADRALNVVWPKVVQWAKDMDESTREWQPQFAIAHDSLLKAQRAWIDYRDGHCETEGMAAAGGSMQPMLVSGCKATLTRKRTEELLLLLETN